MMSFCESSFPNRETSPINCHLVDMPVSCKLHFKATLLTDTSRTPPASQNEVKINETTNEVNSHNVISLAEAETFPSSCLPLDVPVARKLHFGATLLPDTSSPPARQNKGKIDGIESTKLTQDNNEQQKRKRDHMSSPVKEKVRQSFKKDVDIKGKPESVVANFPKDKLAQKTLPNFKSFIVEEEEGSGGYGIVYRATRKSDRKMFAIKCPHANSHRHHVTNEMKMLKRLGERNFIIKYEGSFKSENSDCFILEHVDHDRPENAKKGVLFIDFPPVLQLQLKRFEYDFMRGTTVKVYRIRLLGDYQHSTRIAFVEFVMLKVRLLLLTTAVQFWDLCL